jgi:hypothetical protein
MKTTLLCVAQKDENGNDESGILFRFPFSSFILSFIPALTVGT